MIVSLTSWEANSAWARTESESLHAPDDEEQNEGLRFCPLKSQQQHLAVCSQLHVWVWSAGKVVVEPPLTPAEVITDDAQNHLGPLRKA